MLDAYVEGKLDAVYLCYTKFINTMKQEPVVEQLLPLSSEGLQAKAEKPSTPGTTSTSPTRHRHRRPADALHRSAGLPGRGREHGQRAERRAWWP
jgi:hypothetical protein